MSKLTNRSRIKAEVLKVSAEIRAGKFKRVAGSFFDLCEGEVKIFAAEQARRMKPASRLTNHQHLKQYMMDVRAQEGLPVIDKISPGLLDAVDARVAELISNQVVNQHGAGLTLQGATE